MAIRYCEPVDRDNERLILDEMVRLDWITSFHQNSQDALYDAEVWIGQARLLVECRTRISGGGKPIHSKTYSTVKFSADKYKEACKRGVDGYRFVVQYTDRCVMVRLVEGLTPYLGVQHDRKAAESAYCVDLPLENAIELWKGTVAVHKTKHLIP